MLPSKVCLFIDFCRKMLGFSKKLSNVQKCSLSQAWSLNYLPENQSIFWGIKAWINSPLVIWVIWKTHKKIACQKWNLLFVPSSYDLFQVLRKAVEKRSLYDNLDVTMLIVDEVVDGGIVMESDANSLVQRVAVRSEDIPLGEQTVAQVSSIANFFARSTFTRFCIYHFIYQGHIQ